MSRGINKVILVGNLGKEPEVRYLESNVAVANFTLATSDSYKNKEGQRVDQTEWHNIVLWRGLAEVAEKFLRKGSKVYIEGKLRTRSYDDKEGNKKYITEIVGDQMVMLDSRSENTSPGGYSPQESSTRSEPIQGNSGIKEGAVAEPAQKDDNYEDDLPF